MNLLTNQHVLILGLGISGLSMARWCVRQGAHVTVADTREAPPSLSALRSQCPQVDFVAGPFNADLLKRKPWQVIGRSPGLPPEQLATVCEWASAHNAAFLGELDLFAQALQALSNRERLPYRPSVLAITGTNGKTTVTTLTGLLVQRSGGSVAVAGNIGPALLDVLGEALDREAEAEAEAVLADAHASEAGAATTAGAGDALGSPAQPIEAPSDPVAALAEDTAEDPPKWVPLPMEPPQPPHLPKVWVLELSSFQLDGTSGGAWDTVPTAATVLNITEDHLDWHGSMAAYAQAKAAVLGARALVVLNRDDPLVMAMKPSNVTVKVSGRNRQQPARPYTSFGLDLPSRPGDWGIETVNGMTWLVRALALDETRQRSRTDEESEVYLQRLMPVDALRIRGRHNAANALAALALATSTGAPLAPMLHGLREYRGEPHRVESVAILNGVEYFDDSKGTNVGATLAAINGLGFDRRLVVILGGDGKGQDFAALADPLARFARAAVFIGRDGSRIRQQVEAVVMGAGVALIDAVNLPEAVRLCAAHAQNGDAVLLSPACASMDMFRDYKHRAEVFVEALRELAAEQGVDLEGSL